MKAIRTVVIFDSEDSEIWSGSMHDFGRENGRDVLRNVCDQLRNN